jgi:small conductance mechanosensitive channel
MAKDGGILYGKNLLVALLIIMAFMILSRILARLTTAALTRSRLDVSLGLKRFFSGMVKKFTVLFGFILALSMIGIDIGPFVAALGVGGFVLGFALQETLGNFAAGILILMYRPFEIGHVVSAAGVTGKVEDISLVSTTFKTPDNQTIVVPNGSVWGGVITNITGQKERRVDLVFGIGYDDDIAKAEAVLGELVKAHPQVLSDPEPMIKVNELADSSVNFVVRPWAKTEDYWDVKFDLTRQVKERFDAEGISIPFPQRDVHLHQVQG